MLKNRKRLSRRYEEDDNDNPMENLTNLFDVMLVFACGLMVALIISLNVDVSRMNQAVIEYKDNGGGKASVETSDGLSMEEMGTVYRDKRTGKTYILDDTQENITDSSGE
ncbi:MAG: DUF2149 domain-containing protein [Clostridiales bacterium]|nr:DUF2149 domain-containing protein [Lachnospiraceae bacterium]MDD6617109.1 DUF2149 domain-containing protein [Clostridiales bacterium]